jgi:hypothetical protein
MDWLTWVLLESAAALGAMCFVVVFVALVHWRRSGRPRPLVVALAASALLLTVQQLIVTRRETATGTLDRIAADIRRSRTDALADALSPSFRAAGLNRDEFLAVVQKLLQSVRIVSPGEPVIRISGSEADRFSVSAAYMPDIVFREYSGRIRTRWDISFERTPAGWKITNIEPAYIDGVADPTWPGLTGLTE